MTSEEKNKKPVGRPRLESTIPVGWEEIILDAGARGKHITDFLITLGISWEGHYSLLKRNTKYYETVNEYQKLCEQYWYNMAHNAMAEDGGQEFNSRLWSLIMRNKFGNHWTEQTHVDVTSKGESIDNKVQIEILKNNDLLND